jgi:beta-lactamase superfamily II metal-dependent hydrolase
MNCEIEFLPVGDGSKAGDAVVVRYGSDQFYELMVIDGGSKESGEQIVAHIRSNFGPRARVSHALVTHCDADHASGMREVLQGVPVGRLWMLVPWWSATEAKPYFKDKRWTNDGLEAAIRREYDIIDELVRIAQANNIPIDSPFAGRFVGPFRVLSPHKTFYEALVPQFDRTPDPDQMALQAADFWIGKQPNAFYRLYEQVLAKLQSWTTETWEGERLREGGITSATNESSTVLYRDGGDGRRFLLTGDAGQRALANAVWEAKRLNLPLQNFSFVQVPHHGSRRNVGPAILDALLGPKLAQGSALRFVAFVSAPKDDSTHPRQMVINAFLRRGAGLDGRPMVAATQGKSIIYWGGFSARSTYTAINGLEFVARVEEYD